MKFVIIISAVIVVLIGTLVFLAFRDSDEKGVCTQTLETCLNECDKDKFFEGGYCVFKCSLTNTACLVISPTQQ